jgi:hypothetical protein
MTDSERSKLLKEEEIDRKLELETMKRLGLTPEQMNMRRDMSYDDLIIIGDDPDAPF